MEAKLLHYLQKEIDLKHIPGAIIHVSYKGEIILQEAIGDRVVNPKKSAMKMDTIFDLATLVKVVSTLSAILKLIDQGEIRLDDMVLTFFLNSVKMGKKELRLDIY